MDSAVAADATHFEQVQSTVEKAVSYFGHLDILINLSSLLKPQEIESDLSKWQQIIEVNLFGSYHYCRSVIPYFLQQKSGKIINMGVNLSDPSYPLFCASATAKHSIIGLTKSLAEELQQHNIQINAVCPTLSHKLLRQGQFYESEIPLEQLAEVILFLASSASDGITGECLRVLGKPYGLRSDYQN